MKSFYKLRDSFVTKKTSKILKMSKSYLKLAAKLKIKSFSQNSKQCSERLGKYATSLAVILASRSCRDVSKVCPGSASGDVLCRVDGPLKMTI